MYCGQFIAYATITVNWAGNASEENISFCGGMVSGLSTSDTHIGFEVLDGTFYNSSYFIDAIPFIRITLDTRKHAQMKRKQ